MNLVIKGSNLFLQRQFFKGTANGSVELYYDNSKKFDGAGVTKLFSNQLNVSGVSTFNNHVNLGDEDEIQFGDDNDAKITVDTGQNFVIQGNGTTYLRGSTVNIGSNGGSGGFQNDIVVSGNSSNSKVELKYAGNKKLETTSDGVTVTGSATVTEGLVLDGQNGSGKGLRLDLAGSSDYVIQETTTNDIVQFGGTGSSNFFTHNISSGNIGIGTTNPDRLLHLQAASSTAYSGGSDSADYNFLKIENRTDDRSAGVFFLIGSNGEAAITATEVSDGATDIAFQNRGGGVRSEKLRISSGGEIGIGTDNPQQFVHIHSAGTSGIVTARIQQENFQHSNRRWFIVRTWWNKVKWYIWSLWRNLWWKKKSG